MKGLAHIGALKVLDRYGITPDEYVGTSVGAFIGAMAAGGLSPDELQEIGLGIRKSDILDYDYLGLLWRRGRSQSLYRGKALHDFIRRTLPEDRFDRLPLPLFVTSVDLNSGREVIWGMPGYRDIPLHDCVVASCSLPGIYPPKKISSYYFVDGGVVDTLPVKVAVYTKAELIIAIYLEPAELLPQGVERRGLAAILQQAESIVSRTLVRHNLQFFDRAPIVLVQPRVAEHGIFDFRNTADVIRAGEEAAEAALRASPLLRDLIPGPLASETPLPRRMDLQGSA